MNKSPSLLLIILAVVSSISVGKELEYPLIIEPDPTRLWPEVSVFEEAYLLDKPPVGGIVCTGSSSMRMWHSRIHEDLRGLTILPRGFGGSHFTDVIYYLDELVLKYKPRALLIYEGDNDAAYGKTPERIFSDFKYLVFRCRKELPNLRFYIIGSKPSMSRWHISEDMQAANSLIKAYCQKELDCTYIDVWPSILGTDGKPRREFFMKDDLHLNNTGYDKWTKVIAPVLQKYEAKYE